MLSAARRGLRRVRDDDAGFSLVELLVSMGLATILGALTMTLFITVNSSSAATTDRSVGAGQARTTLLAWSSYLRVSDGPTAGSSSHRFEWITPTSTLFYADLNNRAGTAAATAPTMIWLRYDSVNQLLVEEQFTQFTPSPSAYSTCRVLADHVSTLTITGYTAGTSTNLGPALTPANQAGHPCLALTGSVTQTDPVANTNLAAVTSVGLDFTIAGANGSRTQEYSSVVTVPQLGS